MGIDLGVSVRTKSGGFRPPTLDGLEGAPGFRRRVKITTEELRSLYRPGVQDSEVGNVQMSARVCVVRRRRCHKERLACVRVRVLAATREATVVHVYNTEILSHGVCQRA